MIKKGSLELPTLGKDSLRKDASVRRRRSSGLNGGGGGGESHPPSLHPSQKSPVRKAKKGASSAQEENE